VSDIDTAVVDSLKALDPERPIREATKMVRRGEMTRSANSDRCTAEKCFFASAYIQNKAALRELRDCEA
jgi:hypothetical protein